MNLLVIMSRPLFVLGVLVLPAVAHAEAMISPSGKQLTWPIDTEFVVEVVEAPGTLAQQAIIEHLDGAFSVWTGESSSAPRVTVQRSQDPTVANSNRIHRVNVVNEDWIADEETLAVTTYTFKKSTGEITDADILINGTGPCMTFEDKVPERCFDARAIILHEVGHFLGLDHTRSSNASIMYPTLLPGDESKRALAQSDVNDMRAAYPGSVAISQLSFSSSNVARSGCAAQEPNIFSLLLSVLILQRSARRRTKRIRRRHELAGDSHLER